MSDSTRARLVVPTIEWAKPFVSAARRSRSLHGRWVSAPNTAAMYDKFISRLSSPSFLSYLICNRDDSLIGVVNISEIVRGAFRSAYLGYYAFVPHDGRGLMRAGLARVIAKAFRHHGLHRLEANIQPDNTRSIRLVRSLGFQCEGYSPRYLKINGRWRDHERWAVTQETWAATSERRSSTQARRT